MEKKILYHIVNGEIRETSDEAQRIISLISKQDPIANFESEHSETGYYLNEIYAITGGLVVVSKWIALPPYCWEERVITFIKIP